MLECGGRRDKREDHVERERKTKRGYKSREMLIKYRTAMDPGGEVIPEIVIALAGGHYKSILILIDSVLTSIRKIFLIA